MTRSAPQPSLNKPRWVRGLAAVAMLAVTSSLPIGCTLGAISYVARDISPLHPTGWSFVWPILPAQQQRLEEDIAREERDKVPILDPAPGEFAPPSCLDPPSDAEVWMKVPKFRHGCPPFYEVQRNNANFIIEKIGDAVDPVKIYPLAGPCQLIHCHYKCTVHFEELYWSDYPIPFHHRSHRVEVVYIDKDYLRRAAGPQQAVFR